MNPGWRRRAADVIGRAVHAAMPSQLQAWGGAVRAEIAGIPDEGRALLFAVSSFCGLVPRVAIIRLLHQLDMLAADYGDPAGTMDFDEVLNRPRVLGILCAVLATGLGLAYLAAAGAPAAYLGVNGSALAIGLVLLAIIGRLALRARFWPGAFTLVLAGLLLATALFGVRVEGAARWLKLGAVFVQPSLVLVPVMLVGFAGARNGLSTVGIALAALALALQPDRAMAGALVAGLVVLASLKLDRLMAAALFAAIICFAITLVRPDTLPPSPYVDQILYASFDVHVLAGAAVFGGSILLLVPAAIGLRHDARNRCIHAVFGGVWLAVIVAAAMGNYPTPVVGYGGSAIIGYLLSLTMLPRRAGVGGLADAAAKGGGSADAFNGRLRVVSV